MGRQQHLAQKQQEREVDTLSSHFACFIPLQAAIAQAEEKRRAHGATQKAAKQAMKKAMKEKAKAAKQTAHAVPQEAHDIDEWSGTYVLAVVSRGETSSPSAGRKRKREDGPTVPEGPSEAQGSEPPQKRHKPAAAASEAGTITGGAAAPDRDTVAPSEPEADADADAHVDAETQIVTQQYRDDRTAFVVNLDFSMDRRAVQDLFREYGTVVSVRLMSKGKKSIGRAYVEFTRKVGDPSLISLFTSCQSDCAAAISGLNGTEVRGRRLRVEQSKPKDQQTYAIS